MKALYHTMMLGLTLWNFCIFASAKSDAKGKGSEVISDAKGSDAKGDAKGEKTSDPESDAKDNTESISGKHSEQATLEVTDVHSTSSSGLDTINMDSSGNWLEKRIWYKKGEDLFDEIRTIVKKASDIRMEFVHEVNSIGKKIDEFYEHVSFEKGQIDQLLKDVLGDLGQAEVLRGGDLSSSERSLKLSVKNEQKQIESIGADVKKVDDFDSQIDKTMMQAFKIIDECRGLETKSWNNFKAIGAELDDKKARTLYYEIDNAYKNIEQKIKYLQSTLLPYLKTKLIAPAEQAMTKVQQTVKSLDDKGINLEKLLKGDEKDDDKVVKEREEEKEKGVEGKWEKQQKEAMEKKEKEEQEAKEKAKQQAAEKKKEEEESTWYYRFGSALLHYTCIGACWIMDKSKIVICHVGALVRQMWQKILDHSPLFLSQMADIAKSVFCKTLDLALQGAAFIKCVLCKIWAWASSLFS